MKRLIEDFADACWFWPVFLADMLDIIVRAEWTSRLMMRVERRAGL